MGFVGSNVETIKVKGALRQRIAMAKSHEEVDTLLQTGLKDYKYASDKTIRKWKKTAKARKESLSRGNSKAKKGHNR